jgi:hypothetical protein
MTNETRQNPVKSFPEIMTQNELCQFLRLPEVTNGQKSANVICNLRRMRGLPCVHICRQPLYWLPAVREWLKSETEKEQRK